MSRTIRTSLPLLAAIFFAAAIYGQNKKGLLDELTAKDKDGQQGSQGVAGPGANAHLEIELAPEVTQIGAGDNFRIEIVVEGDPLVTANDVNVELRAAVRRNGKQIPPGQELRFGPLFQRAQDSESEIDCSGEGEVRTCAVGSIGAGARSTVSATLRTNPNAKPGEIVVTARALIGQTPRDSEEVVIPLVEKPTLTNVGLTLTLESGSAVGAPGLEIDQAVLVHNSSAEVEATEVVVTIQQRLLVMDRSGIERLGNDQFATVIRAELLCRDLDQKFQCALGTLAPKATRRIPIQTTIRAELPPRARGALETRARIRSKERDPKPQDNLTSTSVAVISRQPELAFISPMTNARGLPEFVRQQTIGPGQVFRIAARYAHVLVEPTAAEVTVTFHVQNARPTTVALHRSAIPGDRVFRSAPFILLPPGDQTDPEGNSPIRAVPGTVLAVARGALRAQATVR